MSLKPQRFIFTTGCSFNMILNQLINAGTIGSVFFLSLLAWSKKGSTRYGYWFLALLFLSIAFIFSDASLEYIGAYEAYPFFILLVEPLLFVFGPLIYLSVVYLTTPEKNLSFKIAPHFIPYLMACCLYVFAFFSNDSTLASIEEDDRGVEIALLFLFFAQLIFYLIGSIRKLRKYRLGLPLFVSNLPDNNYYWLTNVIIGLSFISVVSFTEVVFDRFHLPFYFSILYLAAFYYIGIQVTRQKDVFPFTSEQQIGVSELIGNHAHTAVEKTTEEELTRGKRPEEALPTTLPPVRKAVIADEKINEYRDQLLRLMESDKPFLDSDITLPSLGRLLNLTTYQTSYLINRCFNENFYQFINRYRLQRCMQMFRDPAYNHLSILGIAFESGFNSKTTFNTAFKKATGSSPKEFRQGQVQ